MFWLGKQRLNISKNWTKAVICLTENIYYSNISKNRKQNKQIDFVLWSKKKEEQNLFFPFGRFYFAPKKSKSEEQFVAEIGTKYNEESTYNISCLTFQFETKKIFLSIWSNPNFLSKFYSWRSVHWKDPVRVQKYRTPNRLFFRFLKLIQS